MRNARITWACAAVLYAGLIFYFSSMPSLPIEQAGAEPFPFFDKIMHFLEYMVFGLLILQASKPSSKRWLLACLAAGALYGALDEVHQSFVPNRDSEFLDFVADSLGVASSLVIFKIKSMRC